MRSPFLKTSALSALLFLGFTGSFSNAHADDSPLSTKAVLLAGGYTKPSAEVLGGTVTISKSHYAEVAAAIRFRLNAGENVVVLQGLPTQLVPSTISPDRFSAAVTLRSSSYRPANLSPQAAQARLINEKAKLIVAVGEKRVELPEEFTVKAMNGTTWLVQDKDGSVQTVENVAGWKIKEMPSGLNNTPSLTITLSVEKTGVYDGIIRYRTRGFNYRIGHQWEYNELKGTIDIATDGLINNRSGAGFNGVDLVLVAGDASNDSVEMFDAAPAPRARGMQALAAAPSSARLEGVAAAAPQIDAVETEAIAGKQSYAFPKPATLQEESETKIPFYRKGGVKVERENRVTSYGSWYQGSNRGQKVDQKVTIVLKFANNEKAGLGVDLPSGPVSVLARNTRGNLTPIGGWRQPDLAKGDKVNASIGSDWDFTATRKVESFNVTPWAWVNTPAGLLSVTEDGRKIRYRERTLTWNLSTEVKNSKDHEVSVIIEEAFSNPGPALDSFQLQPGDHGFRQVAEDGHYETTLKVAPNGATGAVRYTVVSMQRETVVEPKKKVQPPVGPQPARSAPATPVGDVDENTQAPQPN